MYKNNFCSIDQIDKNIEIIKKKLNTKKRVKKRILIKKVKIRKN